MATLRNKRKLAAVSRETPESTRNGRTQNVLDPDLTQDYISQVSEEIEGRVTKNLSKEFSRTESRILGALSKLDEFLLNPQVRTCSVVASGTSGSNNFDNQGTNEDRPSDDPGPEVEFASPISRAETNPHKSLTTTMPTFDGKSEKFELFEDLFQTSLKIHNQLTEEDKINYFHSLMRGDALQTFKNITSPNRENLVEILNVSRRKYVKPQSMATAKHKFQRLVFNPANQKLIDFLDELQKLAKDAFGVAAQAIIEQFIYAKMPPHLKKSINQAHLENGTYEQIVSDLERELELNGLEAPDEMQLNSVMQQDTRQNSEKPKPACHHCKKPGHYRNQCRQLKRGKDQAQNNTDSASTNKNNNGSAQTNSNPNQKATVTDKANNANNQRDRKPKSVFPPCETCGRTNHSTERCYLGANAANRPPPRNRRPEGQNQAQQRNTQNGSDGNVQAAAQPLN